MTKDEAIKSLLQANNLLGSSLKSALDMLKSVIERTELSEKEGLKHLKTLDDITNKMIMCTIQMITVKNAVENNDLS